MLYTCISIIVINHQSAPPPLMHFNILGSRATLFAALALTLFFCPVLAKSTFAYLYNRFLFVSFFLPDTPLHFLSLFLALTHAEKGSGLLSRSELGTGRAVVHCPLMVRRRQVCNVREAAASA